MPLIKCPKCQKKLSDKNKKCPHCGYYLKKNTKLLVGIVVGILLIIVVLIIIINFSNSMTHEEKIIYDIIAENRVDFKDPSSVKVIKATYCSDKSSIITVNAKNSYGGYEQETFYVYNGNLLEEMDFDEILETYRDDKDELRRQYYIYQAYKTSVENVEQECDSDGIVNLSDNSISKINKKLSY